MLSHRSRPVLVCLFGVTALIAQGIPSVLRERDGRLAEEEHASAIACCDGRELSPSFLGVAASEQPGDDAAAAASSAEVDEQREPAKPLFVSAKE